MGALTDGLSGGLSGLLTWWGGWLPAFVLTCAIEVPVYLLMLELFGLVRPGGRLGSANVRGRDVARGRIVWLVIGLNALTHPAFWAVALCLGTLVQLVAGEVVVTAVEGGLLWVAIRRRPLACQASAAVANVASAVLGSAALGLVISAAS